MLKEIWKPIKGYKGYYEVSNHGRVRALSRTVRDFMRKNVKRVRTFPARLLKLTQMQIGYYSVALSKKGKVSPRYVHRLVAEAFIGPIRKPLEVNHKDGVKTNNLVTNLEIVSRSGNQTHWRTMRRQQRQGLSA